MPNATLNAEATLQAQREISGLLAELHADTKRMVASFGEVSDKTKLNSVTSIAEFFAGLDEELTKTMESVETLGRQIDAYIKEVEEIDNDDLHIGE